MNTLQKLISYLSKIRQMPRAWRYTVTALACVVIFVTTYALVLPAITVDQDTAEADPAIVLEEKAEKETEAAEEIIAETTAPEDAVLVVETAETEAPETEAYEEAETEIAATEETEAEEVLTEEVQSEDNTEIESESEISEIESETMSDETEASETEMAAETEEDPSYTAAAGKLTYAGDDYKITVSYDVSANLPADAKLLVEEIYDGGSAEMQAKYDAYYEKSLEAVRKKGGDGIDISFARYFDISIMYEGEKLEPASDVDVKITYNKKSAPEVAEQGDVKVVHFEDGKADAKTLTEQKNDVSVSTSNEKLNEVTFKTDGFSVYGIVGTESVTVPFTDGDGRTYEVTVSYGKDAGIPEGAQLVVDEVTEENAKYDNYVEQAADAIDSRAVDLSYVKLLDIRIVDADGNKVTLDGPVNVEIRLMDKDESENTKIIHFEGADEKAIVMDSETEGDAVSFETDGFSIYAVVEEGNQGDYARMNLHFMNGTNEVAMIIVKNGDTREELDKIIYDPGVGTIPEGTIFKGWSTTNTYTVEDADNGMLIDDVRDWAEERTITENEDVYLYAMLYKNFVVNYLDENNVGVGSENVFMLSSDTSSDYTINMIYTPKDDTHAFLGWNVAEGGSNIAGHTEGKLYEYGDDITISGNVTFSVNAPEGHWLLFDENGKGATYNAPVFLETNDVTARPVPDSEMIRYGYTFGGWYDTKEHADAHGANPSVTTGAYQFGNTINDKTTIYASWIPNATAGYTIIIWRQNVNGDGYDFAETVSGTGNVGSNIPLGNTVNRQYTGFHLKETPAAVQIVPEGNAVVNVYYDRTEYTLNFQVYDYTYTVSTNDNDNNPAKYGDVNGQKARVYWNNGAFRTSNSWYGTVYTGTVYTRSNNESWQTVKAITALYEQNISSNFPIVGTNGVTYNNGERWDPQSNNQGWNEVMVFIETMPAENVNFHLDTATRPLKTMYYYVEALPTDTENVVTRNGTRYVLYNTISARYNGVTEEDFVELDGFTKVAAAATVNGQALTPRSFQGLTGLYYIASTTQDQSIYFFYSRDSYVINYMDGVYVDGNGNTIDEDKVATWGTSEEILYQSDISSYNKGGADYYAPTKAGYAFEGWYIDNACTQPYTFTNMPKDGVTVYAKWRQIQYRVFLHPNADHIADLDWGSENQAMNFRVSIGGTVSTPTGRSQEWVFVGWYTDPSCSASSLFTSDKTLNESTVTTPYDKTTDFTDVMDKWGNGATYNVDITGYEGGDRFWITKKLDLYGKWRAKLVGANGIGVVYNAGEGTNAPSDRNLYLDQAQATAQPASTAPAGKQFVRWVVQKWDTETEEYKDTEISVYPGDSFEVLKENAYYVITGYANPDDPEDISETQDATHTEIVATYTVQLRAEYIDTGAGVPTHINWYGNNETSSSAAGNFVLTDTGVLINQGINVKPENTFTYEGHKFLGWARVPISTDEGEDLDPTLESLLSGNSLSLEELGVDDLFLKYVEASGGTPAHYEATGATIGASAGSRVSQVAPDERYPYHAMVAIWEVNTFKVTIKKSVEGITTSENFTINYDFDDEELEDGSVTLQHDASQELSVEVPYGTIITLSETAEGYDQNFDALKTTDASGKPLDTPVAAATEGTGAYKIQGDTTITVINTREKGSLEISKITDPEGIADDKSFKVSIKNSANEYLQDTETISFGTTVQWFDISVNEGLTIEELPTDTYTVAEDAENASIEGYRFNGAVYNPENGSVTVVKDETSELTVTNSYTKLADVMVTKVLDDNYPEGSESFRFTPVLMENGVDVTDQYFTELTDGAFTLTPAGETGSVKTASITFEDLPVGAILTLTETADEKYTTTITVNGSTAEEAALTIADVAEGEDGNTIEFTNIRKSYLVDFKKTALDGTPLDDASFNLKIFSGSYVNYPDGSMTLGTGSLNLVPGSYELTENSAPEGYIILSNTIRFTVDEDGNVSDPVKDDGTADENLAVKQAGLSEASVAAIVVKNTPGKTLPSTGGTGKLPYTLSGMMLIITSALMYGFRMRRRERRLK